MSVKDTSLFGTREFRITNIINESYIKKIINLLKNDNIKFGTSEDKKFRSGEVSEVIILKVKKYLGYDWIISSREENLISLVIVGDETTHYAYIDLKKEDIVSVGKTYSYAPLDSSLFSEDSWNFIKRLTYLNNNATSFILSL